MPLLASVLKKKPSHFLEKDLRCVTCAAHAPRIGELLKITHKYAVSHFFSQASLHTVALLHHKPIPFILPF